MGLKKSLVEVTHDDGYGDSLLMHINHAFGGKDMRAERVVGPFALSVKIETQPTEWIPKVGDKVRVIKPDRRATGLAGVIVEDTGGEYAVRILNAKLTSYNLEAKDLQLIEAANPSETPNSSMSMKVEKPKYYRPFANAAEYRPFKDSWLFRVDEFGKQLPGECRVSGFDDEGIWLCDNHHSYEKTFALGRKFADGTPFGIEE